MKVFLSYRFADEPFVRSTSYYLTSQSDLIPYFFGDETHTGQWVAEVSKGLADADAFVLFIGTSIGEVQEWEADALAAKLGGRQIRVIKLPGADLPPTLEIFRAFKSIPMTALDEKAAQDCAMRITKSLGSRWIPVDDIPDEYIFDYEKDIIQAFSQDSIKPELIDKGCPLTWPSVERQEFRIESPLREEDIGLFRDWNKETKKYRKEESLVLAGALKGMAQNLVDKQLCFPEAGPRKRLSYPARPRALSVGILVSGGIAPGINAVIAGIVERQTLYAQQGHYRLNIHGYQNGLSGIYHPGNAKFTTLTREDVEPHAHRGGSILGTSRLTTFVDENPQDRRQALVQAVRHLTSDGIEILYIIGGDGSMRAAHALWKTAREEGKDISIIGVPKTMDNDILWVWQSFGFLSAVQRSRDLIQDLYTETRSNPRLCVIQLFGSDSGFVVTHAVSALGVCDLFLIPEVPFTMKKVCKYIGDRLKQRYDRSKGLESAFGMIVMSETAIPQDAANYFGDSYVGLTAKEKEEITKFLAKQRVFGQTPDELRRGGLKLVSRVIQKYITTKSTVFKEPYWRNFRVFTNEPRHLIRAVAPSSLDTITAKRLGSLAVDGAMAGYTDFMISQWLTEYVMVPLRLVILGRKRIPQYGVFYKSARASTDQPADLK